MVVQDDELNEDICVQKLTSWLNQDGNDPSNRDRTIFHLFYGDPNALGSRRIGRAWYNDQ